MSPEEMLKQAFARIERLEAIETRRSLKTQRRASLLRSAGKLCPVLAVLGLATWALGQGVEIKTSDGAADQQRLKIDTGAATVNAYFMNSKLGVGTATPARKLDVVGTITSTGSDASFTSNGWQRNIEIQHAGTIMWNKGAGDYAWGIGKSSAASALYFFRSLTGDAANPALYDMVIDNAGKVGVATVAPAAQLEVAGTGEIMLTESSPQIKFNDTDAGAWRYWIHNNSDRLYFLNDGGAGGGWTGSRPLTIYQNDVGIGTATPAQSLDVAGGNIQVEQGREIRWSGNTGTNTLNFNKGGSKIYDNAQLYVETDDDIHLKADQMDLLFKDAGSTAVRIDNVNNEFLILQGNATAGGSRHVAIGPSGAQSSNLYVRGQIDVRGDGSTSSAKIFANDGASIYTDWNAGWGGGLATWDIVCAGIEYNALVARSDRRLKKNIAPVGDSLDRLLRLRPVSFEWKDPKQPGSHLGFIAQEVEEVIPELVQGRGEETRSLAQTEMIPLLVKGTQELNDALRDERRDRKALEERLARTEEALRLAESSRAGLEARLAALEKKSEVRNSKSEAGKSEVGKSEVGKSGGGGE